MSFNMSSANSTEENSGYIQLGGTKKSYDSSIKNNTFASPVFKSSFDATFELGEGTVDVAETSSTTTAIRDNSFLTEQKNTRSPKETFKRPFAISTKSITTNSFVKPSSESNSLPCLSAGSILSSVEAVNTPNLSCSPYTSSPSTPHASFRNAAFNSRNQSTSFDTPGSVASRTSSFSSGTASITSMMNRDSNGNFVLALVEFHNRQQVGIAAFDTTNSKVYLSQFSDNHMYTNTLSLLNCYDPQIILMSDTAADSILCQIVRRDFQLAQMHHIKRKYFNETIGLEYIQRLCIKENTDALDLQAAKYLCISACACLLKYLEFQQEMTYAPQSLSITMSNIDGYMQLDISTVSALELVSVQQQGFGKLTSINRRLSLFDVLNHTKTRAGARLLRTTILQPLKDLATLQMRLDAISELLSNENLFFSICTLLGSLTEIDSICSSLVFIPRKMTLSIAQTRIANMMSLRTMLVHLTALSEALLLSKNELLHALGASLVSPSLDMVQKIISSFINEEVVLNKNNTEQMRTQIVYAVQSGIDSMLDVARETYCEALEDLYAESAKTIERLYLGGAKLHYTTSRGYHLVVPASSLPPERHIDVVNSRVYRGTKVFCSTNTIQSLDNRQQEAFHDTCFFTSKVIADMVAAVRMHIGWMYTVNDVISLLDMLASFASHIALNAGYVRPQFIKDGPIVIKQGRHPILDLHKSAALPTFVPNDSYMTDLSNVVIVTGPNNSGKSTHIRQIALLVIMAHMGCYVPAQVASFRVINQVFTCMASSISASTSFSVEADRSSSSFYTEMRDMSRILLNVKPKSLVLLDEVGRSTSNIDGVALAWSLCEALARRSCFCLFATHFLELSELAEIYPTVKNICLEVEYENTKNHRDKETNSEPSNITSSAMFPHSLRYSFRVASGSTAEKSSFYGIAVAQAAAFPTFITTQAYSLAKRLREGRVNHTPDINVLKSSALHTLLARLLALPYASSAAGSLVETKKILIDISANFAAEVQKIQGIVEKNEEERATAATIEIAGDQSENSSP